MAASTKSKNRTSNPAKPNTEPLIKRDGPGPLAARVVEPKRPTTEMICERAYQIYLARKDQEPSNPLVDWIQAERELLAER